MDIEDQKLTRNQKERLINKNAVLSEIFESPKGDKPAAKRRVICEIFRSLYALTVIDLKDNPEAMKRHIELLEEGFLSGIKMINKLAKYKLDYGFGSIDNADVKKYSADRREQKRVFELLKTNDEFLKRFDK